ncbi:MAG: glycerol-3-phosphate acyltransferase [Clostridia bacterium]|nr:glycerol-3-phosphate acyltransferase [Clostridia bacterium]
MVILDYWWQLLLGALLVYLVCNTNFAILISKNVKNKDIRTVGSGNPGTTNMIRAFGFKWGACTFALDATKGALSVAAGLILFSNIADNYVITRFAGYFFAMSAILGHVFPVCLKFKGGKGFATTIGAFMVLDPLWTGIFLATGVILLVIWDYMSVFALFFATSLLVKNIIAVVNDALISASGVAFAFIIAIAVVWFVVIIAHRSNIKRLFTACENKTGIHKLFKKKNNG